MSSIGKGQLASISAVAKQDKPAIKYELVSAGHRFALWLMPRQHLFRPRPLPAGLRHNTGPLERHYPDVFV